MVVLDGLPPCGDGGFFGGGGEGGDEIGDDGFLGGVEIAVPDEVDGYVAGEERAVVVL